MESEDELCLCFHVSKNKVQQFLRVEQPKRASQLSDCGGAGTGCGWCRPYLKRLFDQSALATKGDSLPSAEDYARLRQKYIQAGKGTPPPGAS